MFGVVVTSMGTSKNAASRWVSQRHTTREYTFYLEIGAGEGIRTLDPDLGKVVLYH